MLKIFLLICFAVNFLVDSIPIDESVIEGRIIGGNATEITQVPYMIAEFEHNTFMCGAFIVSSTHILTTARCLAGAELTFEVFIRAGSSYNKKDGLILKAKKLYMHPKFEVWDYDVGIIELATPLKLNDKTIKPPKLATKEPPTGSVVLISGWGFTNVPTYDRAKCEKIYKEHNVTITPRMICGTVDKGMPQFGDTGGPVVYKGKPLVWSLSVPENSIQALLHFTPILPTLKLPNSSKILPILVL